MATQKVVIAGSAEVSAPQLTELFRQIGTGAITGKHLQALIEHRDPFELQFTTVNVGSLEGLYAHLGSEFVFSIEAYFSLLGKRIVSYNEQTLAILGAPRSTGRTIVSYTDIPRKEWDRHLPERLATSQVEGWHIAAMISCQRDGENGPLLTGRSDCNVFLVNGKMLVVKRYQTFWNLPDLNFHDALDGFADEDGTVRLFVWRSTR